MKLIKSFTSLLFSLLLTGIVFGQPVMQQQKIDSVKNLIMERFNKKDADGLYTLAGQAFKKALSDTAFKAICESNLFQLGEFSEAKFESYSNGVSKYKSSFQGTDQTNLSMFIGLDSFDKIEVFFFQPYNDDKAVKSQRVRTSNSLITPLDKKVDEIIQSYINKKITVGVSIGILKNDRAHYYNYGQTALENNRLPDSNTIYEIGSISKTFTSILLADAVRRKKLSLDDPVNRYLPDSIGKLEYGGVPITLRTLANHTSGLPRLPSNISLTGIDALNPYKKYSVPLLFSFLKNFKPYRKPGARYEYSNLAVGLLGTIIERINNKSFNDLVIEKICIPLRMDHTRQYLRKSDSASFAKGYTEYGNPASYWDIDALAGAGALRSTASDLLKYGKANIKTNNKNLDDIIQLTHVVTFSEPGLNTKVGLAWHIIKPGNDELLFHNGGTGGFRSYLAINPAKKIVVVILSNTALGVETEGDALMKSLESQ